jgi:hypothetical protein
MKSKFRLILFFTVQSLGLYAQSVSTSPYSIYGLGSLYETNFGPISAIGSSGIALPTSSFINSRNPASLGYIGKNSFFFDTGLKGIETSYENETSSEKRNNFQFSHIAIAFPINSRSGFSASLKPYSSASYIISNYQLPIDNSNEYYYLNSASYGGLNTCHLSYGYKILKGITLGLTTSFYFGNITNNKNFIIANSVTNINKKSYYNGMRLSLGNQIKIDSTFNIGLTMELPSQIKGSKTQSVSTINETETQYIENNEASDVTDYYLPFEYGVGISKSFFKKFNLTLDYEKSLWKNTNQSSVYGEYKNQDKYALGLSYVKKEQSYKYADKIHYYTGFNYDTGFLSINNKNVNNMRFSIGVGLPLEFTKSALNINYSYGIKGTVGNDLIRENYHMIGLNLSLEAIWFVKRKFE